MAKISQIPGLKLSQNIALTPQLIQAIKLFELNNIELEDYINKEIIDNPFLEKDDEANEEDLEENFFAENQTNQNSIEDLLKQAEKKLSESNFSDKEKYLLSYKINTLKEISQ